MGDISGPEKPVIFGVTIEGEGGGGMSPYDHIVVELVAGALATKPRTEGINPNQLASAVARDFTVQRVPPKTDDPKEVRFTWQQALKQELGDQLSDPALTLDEQRALIEASASYRQFYDSWELLQDDSEGSQT